jgi:class 3 adenylate cyclase/HAMP domain-containing protein
MSLRIKIILAFVAISALVSLSLGLSTYRALSGNLFRELQVRVGNLTRIGSLAIDRGALKRLNHQLAEPMGARDALAVEQSQDYRLVSEQLNRIRDIDKDLVRYVYTFAPTADENMARYLVDADVLELLRAGEEGEISHFGSPFDLADFPVARQAIRETASLVEPEYSYDEVFGVRSVSGYAPILDEDGCTPLAMLGLDMVDTDAAAILRRTTTMAAAVAGLALLIALGTSILLGTYVTRGITYLDRVVRTFSERNLEVRARVTTRDEVGRLGTSFNRMAETIQRYSARQESLLKAYGRFVPHDFLKFLKKESILEVKLGDQVQREMTILFSDIQAFTELSETMSPAENFNFLNSFLSRVGPEIRNHGGFIDKYIGDAIMALFPERAEDAVRAAVAMRRKLVEYNAHRRSSGYVPIGVGIGIHTGNLMLGTVGEQERMDGSVISDAVNLCARLESLTRLYGGTILITDSTLSQLGRRQGFHTRLLDRVQVRGRKQPVAVYEVYDGDSPQQFERKESIRDDWKRALHHYHNREFLQAYKLLAALRPKEDVDPVVELYLRRCARLIKRGVPQEWQGVEVIDVK